MKIAILEDDKEIIDKIRSKLTDIFEVGFYDDTYMFLSECQNFEIVLIDKKFINKDFINQISRYKIEIGLINRGNLDFDDQHISIVLNEDDLDSIEEKLKYFETKIRINKLLDVEQKTLSTMQDLAVNADFLKRKKIETGDFLKKIINNVYYIEVKDEISILEIRGIISKENKQEILEILKKTSYIIITYFSLGLVTSRHLGDLAGLWKDIKKLGGKMVYWNKQNNHQIISVLKMCKMDNLFPIVDTFEQAKLKLKEI